MKKIVLLALYVSMLSVHTFFGDDFTPYNIMSKGSGHSGPHMGQGAEGAGILVAAGAAGVYQGGKAVGKGLNKLGEKVFGSGKHEFDATACDIKNNSTKEITVTNVQPAGFAGTKSTTIKIKPGETQQLNTPFSVNTPSVFVPKCPHGVAIVSNTGVSTEPEPKVEAPAPQAETPSTPTQAPQAPEFFQKEVKQTESKLKQAIDRMKRNARGIAESLHKK